MEAENRRQDVRRGGVRGQGVGALVHALEAGPQFCFKHERVVRVYSP